MSFLLPLTYSLQQNWKKRLNRLCIEVREFGQRGKEMQWGKMAQTMYTHMNK
jgi:hypothetical protein